MLFCFSLAVVMSALFVGGGSARLIRERHLHGVPWTEFVDLTWTIFLWKIFKPGVCLSCDPVQLNKALKSSY